MPSLCVAITSNFDSPLGCLVHSNCTSMIGLLYVTYVKHKAVGQMWPTRPGHVAFAPSFKAGRWRDSIPPPPTLALFSRSPLSIVNTGAFCVYKGQPCSQWQSPAYTHSGDRSPESKKKNDLPARRGRDAYIGRYYSWAR